MIKHDLFYYFSPKKISYEPSSFTIDSLKSYCLFASIGNTKKGIEEKKRRAPKNLGVN